MRQRMKRQCLHVYYPHSVMTEKLMWRRNGGVDREGGGGGRTEGGEDGGGG